METGRWNGHTFVVSPTLIRGFTALTLKAASETKEKTSGNQKYASRKNGKPVEVTMTVTLSALTGCNVRNEATEFAKDAVNGKSDYMYVGEKKIATCKLMLIEANVTEIKIAPSGQWISCQIQLTFRQSSKFSGSSSSSSGTGSSSKKKKSSSKKSNSVSNKSYTKEVPAKSTSAAQKKINDITSRAGKAASAKKVKASSSKVYFLNSETKRASVIR